jgi:hypothetical protein
MMSIKCCDNPACAGNGTRSTTDAQDCILCGRTLKTVFGGGMPGFDGGLFGPPPEAPVNQPLCDAVNAALHRSVNVATPCESACTHVIHDTWTALGIANVVARHAKEA